MRGTDRRLARSLLVIGLLGLAAVLVAGALLLNGNATATVNSQERPANGEPKEGKPASDEDGLFGKISSQGIIEGAVPARQYKLLLVKIPALESWNDDCSLDLAAGPRGVADAFWSILEHHADYQPHLYRDADRRRVARVAARLRFSEVPQTDVGEGGNRGRLFAGLEKAAAVLNAQYIVAVSLRPATEQRPARVGAWRYRAGKGGGVEAEAIFDLPKLGKGAEDSGTKLLESQAAVLFAGIVDKKEQAKIAPVPRLAATDKALKQFVKMRRALEQGEFTTAWIAYGRFRKLDPRGGRAALFGMEIFKAIAMGQSAKERPRFHRMAVEAGVEALRASPNDVMLRGKLAWNAAGDPFNQREWARRQIALARKVQPRNWSLYQWEIMLRFPKDNVAAVKAIEKEMLPLIPDGRAELDAGTTLFLMGDYAGAIGWYERALRVMPGEHEAAAALGRAGTYHAEALQKRAVPGAEGDAMREEAEATFAKSTAALWVAVRIDPTEVQYVFDYYVRVATRSFRRLPVTDEGLSRLFLLQAVLDGLTEQSNTGRFHKLMKGLLDGEREVLLEKARKVKPGDADYELLSLALLRMSEKDVDEEWIVKALRRLHSIGHHGGLYAGAMGLYGDRVKSGEGE